MNDNAVELPEYVCHKRVRAARIYAIALHDGATPEAAGAVLFLGKEETKFGVNGEWYDRHKPEQGGYLVRYADGYVSYSPAKAFEEGYQPAVSSENHVPGDAPEGVPQGLVYCVACGWSHAPGDHVPMTPSKPS